MVRLAWKHWKTQDQSFDVIRIRYINLDSIKLILFSKLESSPGQKQTKITYRLQGRWQYHAIQDIQQLYVCSVQLKYKDEVVRCSFFVVPGNAQALFSLPDIKLLGLLNIMCEVPDQQQVARKFDSQTKEASSTTESRTNSTSSTNLGTGSNCLNIPDYFRSIANKETDMRVSRLLAVKIHSEFSNNFTSMGWLERTFMVWMREGSHPYQALPRRMTYALPRATIRRSWQTTKAANHSTPRHWWNIIMV